GRETRVGAVVYDDADAHGATHGRHVGEQSLLVGFREVMRQEEDALRARAFGSLRVLDGARGAGARARDDRKRIAAGLGRGLEDLAVLIVREGEELARSTGHEERA